MLIFCWFLWLVSGLCSWFFRYPFLAIPLGYRKMGFHLGTGHTHTHTHKHMIGWYPTSKWKKSSNNPIQWKIQIFTIYWEEKQKMGCFKSHLFKPLESQKMLPPAFLLGRILGFSREIPFGSIDFHWGATLIYTTGRVFRSLRNHQVESGYHVYSSHHEDWKHWLDACCLAELSESQAYGLYLLSMLHFLLAQIIEGRVVV